MNTKIDFSKLRLRGSGGASALSAVKIYDQLGRVIYGGAGSSTIASVTDDSWSSVETLLSTAYTTTIGLSISGMTALVGTNPLLVSYSDSTDGTAGYIPVGNQLILGTVADFAADGLGGEVIVSSANFTRPNDTTAYAAGDLVANSTTAGSVTPMSLAVGRAYGASGMIRRARIKKSGANAGTFKLHLFKASPTVTNGDNGAFLPNNSANYIGALAINADRIFSDGVVGGGVPLNGSEMNFVLPAGQAILYGLLEASGATTPAAQEVFTLELEVITL